MAKVNSSLFPNGIGCLKFRPNKNLKGKFAHIAFIKRDRKQKGGAINNGKYRIKRASSPNNTGD